MKVLAFAASLRIGSLNRKLLSAAVDILVRRDDWTVDHADFHEFDVPVYDGDLEQAAGIPPGAQQFVRRILEARALIISAPEYNGGISGALKNAIDWASRNDPIPFEGKPLLLLGASPGRFGAVRGLWHTRVPLEAIGTLVYPQMFALPRAHHAFDERGMISDPKIRVQLEEILASFLSFAHAVSDARQRP